MLCQTWTSLHLQPPLRGAGADSPPPAPGGHLSSWHSSLVKPGLAKRTFCRRSPRRRGEGCRLRCRGAPSPWGEAWPAAPARQIPQPRRLGAVPGGSRVRAGPPGPDGAGRPSPLVRGGRRVPPPPTPGYCPPRRPAPSSGLPPSAPRPALPLAPLLPKGQWRRDAESRAGTGAPGPLRPSLVSSPRPLTGLSLRRPAGHASRLPLNGAAPPAGAAAGVAAPAAR